MSSATSWAVGRAGKWNSGECAPTSTPALSRATGQQHSPCPSPTFPYPRPWPHKPPRLPLAPLRVQPQPPRLATGLCAPFPGALRRASAPDDPPFVHVAPAIITPYSTRLACVRRHPAANSVLHHPCLVRSRTDYTDPCFTIHEPPAPAPAPAPTHPTARRTARCCDGCVRQRVPDTVFSYCTL